MSDVMLFLPQKSSISWVSTIPPINEPVKTPAIDDQIENLNIQWFRWNTHLSERAVAFQQLQIER